MEIELIKSFLLSSTIFNLFLYSFWVIIYFIFQKKVLGLQKEFSDLEEKDIKKIIYILFGFYKFLIIFFNVIPLLVLYFLY